MARHETTSSKPDPTTVANIENPAEAEDQDQYGGGSAAGGSSFAHLTEDMVDSAVTTDWSLVASHDLDTFLNAGGVPGVDIDPNVGALDVFTDVGGPGGFLLYAVDGVNTNYVFTILATGALGWTIGTGYVSPDTHLQRAGVGVLEIPEHGGGLKLTSPDGLTSKTITINNAGAITLL